MMRYELARFRAYEKTPAPTAIAMTEEQEIESRVLFDVIAIAIVTADEHAQASSVLLREAPTVITTADEHEREPRVALELAAIGIVTADEHAQSSNVLFKEAFSDIATADDAVKALSV